MTRDQRSAEQRRWDFKLPFELHGGPGAAALLGDYVQSGRALMLTTAGTLARGTAQKIMSQAPSADWLVRTIEPNPEPQALDSLARDPALSEVGCLVGLGGGSALDATKALALALAQPPGWNLAAYLAAGGARPAPPKPFFCLPTTAGTGAEVTPFGTLWDRLALKKYSLADERLLPRAVFLDPELTLSLSPEETLWGALDSLSHALETLWNRGADIFSLAWAREAIHLILEHLPRVQALPTEPRMGQCAAAMRFGRNCSSGNSLDRPPTDIGVRAAMQQASLLAGLAIGRNRSALAHAISYPLTLRFGLPHGLACSFTLPALIDLVSRREAWRRGSDRDLAEQAAGLLRGLDLPGRLAAWQPRSLLSLTAEMATPGRADNFILDLGPDELTAILKASAPEEAW